MPQGKGAGSDFQVEIECWKKRKWVEITEHNVEIWRASTKRPAGTQAWINSAPGSRYRITINDYHPEKRGGLIQKDVNAVLKDGTTHIDNVILWKAPCPPPAQRRTDEIRFNADDSERDVNIPLLFLGKAEQQQITANGPLGPPGKGLISISMTYGTEILSGDDPRSDPTMPDERINGEDFDLYDNKPFYEFVIHYCPTGTMKHHIALHESGGWATASGPVEPENAVAGPSAPAASAPIADEMAVVEPVPLKLEPVEYIPPTPQSQPVTSPGHSTFNAGQKRPRESSPTDGRSSRTPALENRFQRQAKEIRQKAQLSLLVAKYLAEQEQGRGGEPPEELSDNIKEHEMMLERAVKIQERYGASFTAGDNDLEAGGAVGTPMFREEAFKQVAKLRVDAQEEVEVAKQIMNDYLELGGHASESVVDSLKKRERGLQIATDRQRLYGTVDE